MPQFIAHFERSKFLIPVTQFFLLWNFTFALECGDFRKEQSSNQRDFFRRLNILIVITSTSVGNTYVTTLFNYVYITYVLQMGQSNVLNCTYSGTKLINSYPHFKRALSWQIMSASHNNVT